ncbi:MAG: hypothetical protein JO296_00015 [Pseudonocardiales bacterium]|nr:hypothetical protein [Pseudonocardiales bacterium]
MDTESRLGLAEVLEALRGELREAALRGDASDLHFPVAGVEVKLDVSVTREGKGKAGIKFWVLEFGGSASVAREDSHSITIRLGAPTDNDGRNVDVERVLRDRTDQG